MIALTAIILAVLHRWITDTRLERQVLAAAQRQAQTERATYIAAKAALENEQTRLYRDLAADRAADTQRLAVERQAMQDEFDDARAQLVTEAMATVASWIIDGKVRPPERLAGNLIQFPRQEQQRERAHGHGAVVP